MAILILGVLVIALLIYSVITELLIKTNSNKYEAKVIGHEAVQHSDKKGNIVRQNFKLSLSVYGREEGENLVEVVSRQPRETGELLEIYENRRTGKINLAVDMLTTSPIRVGLMLAFGGFLLFIYFYRGNMVL